MISADLITQIANSHLKDSDLFLTSVIVGPENAIKVTIDGDNGVDIAHCVGLSRQIEQSFDREKEDFSIEVSSHGAEAPLIFPRQFIRHIGKSLQVKGFDASVTKGTLLSADQHGFRIEIPAKKKADTETIDFLYADVKEAKIILSFKNL